VVLVERIYNAKVKHPSNTPKDLKIFASGGCHWHCLLIFIFSKGQAQSYEMRPIVISTSSAILFVLMEKLKRSIASSLLFCVIAPAVLHGQAKMRRLPNTLNNPSYNASAPYLSADANAIVFISDNAEDYIPTPFYSFRESADWKEPQPFPKTIYSRLNFIKGFGLSADGKKVYYTTLKTPSVGGFDIWTSDWKGNAWSEPANVGPPLNSKSHDGAPSVTPDGNTLYFMRCDRMDQNKAESCRLFRVSKKVNGQWDEPAELPATINTGNSQSPRIMADGESLLFSSDKMPGNKGGMDLYMTKFVNGDWSKPVPLDFVNTDKDDQYISVAALGRYLVKDEMNARKKSELIEYLIPDNLRPRGMMKIDGKVADADGSPIPAYVTITDLTKNKRVYSGRPYADGSFIVYIMEGSTYELAIDPEQDNVTYFSKQFDLTSDKIPQVDRVSATIKPVGVNDELSLDRVKFKANSGDLDVSSSSAELKKLMRVVKANPDFKFEIQVLLNGYEEDTIQSNPDLTEVIYDSIHATFDDIDTLGQLYQRDTIVVRSLYHNDRTWQQAQSIIQYLVSQGANESSFGFFGNAIPATLPENKKLTVKAMARRK
jgi:hypothetical protein